MKFDPHHRAQKGFALPMTLIAISGLTILVIGLLALLTLERKTTRSYTERTRAELAAESGFVAASEQITSMLNRADVGGAAFTTWAYHPGGASTPGHLLALTAGRPEFDLGTTAGQPYLNANNTQWLGTTGNDPDQLFTDFQSGNQNVIDFNADGKLGELMGACLARWQDYATEPDGKKVRYAVWVDDETSRIDITQIGRLARADGATPAEVPFFDLGLLPNLITSKQITWRTADMARIDLTAAEFRPHLSPATTTFSRGYDVIAHSPSYADAGASERNGHPLALRGRLKRNLNWSGLLNNGNVDERVERLTEWMASGAQGFFNKRNLNYWPAVSGGSVLPPNYQTLNTSNPFAGNLRREQFRTIAASLIDYLDEDNVPTQPASLAALNFGNPAPGTPPLFLMEDTPRPAYFGADRNIRINEVQIIWNSMGAADNFQANPTVRRTTLPGGLFEYEIPVTFRFELWNMDLNAIAPTAYEVRSFNTQQILSSAFGFTGALPIPEETEIVFPLNSGNPIEFAPNEIRVFNITRTYRRISNADRGTTWNSFRLGGTGTGDDQPPQILTQAHVLLEANTGEWLHATNQQQMINIPATGVCSAGVGNAGAQKGLRVNDPRMTPLRMYIDRTLSGFDRYDRDWANNFSNSSPNATMGTVNNPTGHTYQNFEFWLDRPYYITLSNPLEAITRIENRPMRSAGELGRIFDPSWTHPLGRGATNGPYNSGVLSPFRGGGTLAIGQRSLATTAGNTAADHLDAKPWNIMDIFTIKGDGNSMNNEEFGDPEWRGRVNLNCQKTMNLSAGLKSNHELVMELPDLKLGAAGRPNRFDFKIVANELKNRLTRGGSRPDGSTVTDWRRALPLYSPGQLSELAAWNTASSFTPSENSPNNALGLVNRNDSGREEGMMRAANLITTRSHCYRIVCAGEVLDPAGATLARSQQERVIFFRCTWDATTGELMSVSPQTLYVRSL